MPGPSQTAVEATTVDRTNASSLLLHTGACVDIVACTQDGAGGNIHINIQPIITKDRLAHTIHKTWGWALAPKSIT